VIGPFNTHLRRWPPSLPATLLHQLEADVQGKFFASLTWPYVSDNTAQGLLSDAHGHEDQPLALSLFDGRLAFQCSRSPTILSCVEMLQRACLLDA
jgi:hypothetical protein